MTCSTHRDRDPQQLVLGAGMGLMLGQANTDAVNRAGRFSYGEATGITQTVRNYGASHGRVSNPAAWSAGGVKTNRTSGP
ncbi:MAG: hypothetical protein ACRDPY_18030 [Streptosporangiaceae bacterium]